MWLRSDLKFSSSSSVLLLARSCTSPALLEFAKDMFLSYLCILGCLVATAEQFQVQMVFLLQEILQVILLEK